MATHRALAIHARSVYGIRSDLIEDPETDTQVVVERFGTRGAVVCFRGSESRRDWLTNFRIYRRRTPLGAVHRGFWAAWTSVRTRVLAELVRLDPTQVFVCGHSLGGAIATIAAVDISGALPGPRVECVTFGAPRPGGRALARAARESRVAFHRYVHPADPVPRVPPVLLGNRHVCPATAIAPAPGCLPCVADVLCSPADDHDISAYVQALGPSAPAAA